MLTSRNFFDKSVVQELRVLNGQQKRELIEKLLVDTSARKSWFDDYSSEALVEYISSELDLVRHHRHLFAVQDFDSTVAILHIIRANLQAPYGEVVRIVHSNHPNASIEAIHHSIELSVRLWLTFNIRTQNVFDRPIYPGEVPVDWSEDLSLEQLLRNLFDRGVHLQQQRNAVKVDAAFTATFLVNTCGLKLRWTDDVANHLSFDPRSFVLTVYRHKACLFRHLRNQQSCPISAGVLEEMLDTMDLLFPPFDPATKYLLQKEGQQSLYTLGCHRSIRNLDIAHYPYFGHTLEELMFAFDQTPRTWKQLAFDRRNKLEWSAFWVTVMVAALTVISIPCNIIQATYSVKAYHAALAQGDSGLRAGS